MVLISFFLFTCVVFKNIFVFFTFSTQKKHQRTLQKSARTQPDHNGRLRPKYPSEYLSATRRGRVRESHRLGLPHRPPHPAQRLRRAQVDRQQARLHRHKQKQQQSTKPAAAAAARARARYFHELGDQVAEQQPESRQSRQPWRWQCERWQYRWHWHWQWQRKSRRRRRRRFIVQQVRDSDQRLRRPQVSDQEVSARRQNTPQRSAHYRHAQVKSADENSVGTRGASATKLHSRRLESSSIAVFSTLRHLHRAETNATWQ